MSSSHLPTIRWLSPVDGQIYPPSPTNPAVGGFDRVNNHRGNKSRNDKTVPRWISIPIHPSTFQPSSISRSSSAFDRIIRFDRSEEIHSILRETTLSFAPRIWHNEKCLDRGPGWRNECVLEYLKRGWNDWLVKGKIKQNTSKTMFRQMCIFIQTL